MFSFSKYNTTDALRVIRIIILFSAHFSSLSRNDKKRLFVQFSATFLTTGKNLFFRNDFSRLSLFLAASVEN